MERFKHPHMDEALDVLKNSKVIAVIGISENPERPSYYVSERVLSKGKHKLYFVNPVYAGKEILGINVFSSLKEVPEEVDVVNVFRNPQNIEPVIQEAIEVKAKCVWLQPGSENLEVVERYRDKIKIIWDACIGVEAGYL